MEAPASSAAPMPVQLTMASTPGGRHLLQVLLGHAAKLFPQSVPDQLCHESPVQEMFDRNKRFAPELLKDVNLDDTDVDVIAGLRPYRVENVCVEKEYGFNIVHNYGHGGSGFSLSYGCAREAIGLLESMEGPSFRVVDLRPAAVHQHPATYADLETPDFTTAQLDGQEVSVEQPVYH
ncbi:FAD-dependent oxidoreductase [Streptomyces anulatus]|uniref:FAD-dependent oxidoreductase n=1 Tax=Streptomyces anulatus TaxID=1892 RepID=UPI00343A5146